MTTILHNYKNGDYNIKLYSNGTLERTTNVPNPTIEHPTSMDVKITNYCDLECKYCHEMSNTNGKHADLDVLLEAIKELPIGVEIAFGGGNPLSHPNLISFLEELKIRGIVANITVNSNHIKPYLSLLTKLIKENLIHGIGISVTKFTSDLYYVTNISDNVVFHVINGLTDIKLIGDLVKFNNSKILILGYKQYGFGIQYYSKQIKTQMNNWYMYLPSYIGNANLSFDNLAIKQLNMKRMFTDKEWNEFYMGDDFEFTMYIDAIEQTFAHSSISDNRVKFKDISLINYFKNK